jgi:hypothetical protein
MLGCCSLHALETAGDGGMTEGRVTKENLDAGKAYPSPDAKRA